MGQFAADRAAADDDQPARQLGQREDRFVGEVAGFGQARNVGNGGASAGGDDGPLEAERLAGDFDRLRAGEAGLAEEDIDAEVGESLGRVVLADAGAEPAHAGHDGGEIDV